MGVNHNFLHYFTHVIIEKDVKSCFSVKKLISTSEWHVEHQFAGRNTQHPSIIFLFYILRYFTLLIIEKDIKLVLASKNWFRPANSVQSTRSLVEIHNSILSFYNFKQSIYQWSWPNISVLLLIVLFKAQILLKTSVCDHCLWNSELLSL